MTIDELIELHHRVLVYSKESDSPLAAMRAVLEALRAEVDDWLENEKTQNVTGMVWQKFSKILASSGEVVDQAAEIERLRAALGKIANLDPSQEPWAKTIARKALEEK